MAIKTGDAIKWISIAVVAPVLLVVLIGFFAPSILEKREINEIENRHNIKILDKSCESKMCSFDVKLREKTSLDELFLISVEIKDIPPTAVDNIVISYYPPCAKKIWVIDSFFPMNLHDGVSTSTEVVGNTPDWNQKCL